MAIRLATFKKKQDEVKHLTLTPTKSSPTSYVAVTVFSPFLFPSQNLKRNFSATVTNSKNLDADLVFARKSQYGSIKIGIIAEVISPNNGIKGVNKKLIDEDGWILVTRT